jgi:hypothetical protein
MAPGGVIREHTPGALTNKKRRRRRRTEQEEKKKKKSYSSYEQSRVGSNHHRQYTACLACVGVGDQHSGIVRLFEVV